MAAPLADSLLRYIRKLAGRSAGPGAVSDVEALRRFVGERDEAAFELLVWRYGAMVLRLCRDILHDEHAAEDAFQGTFFVLARKAKTVTRQASLAGWLCQVAYRVALRAQSQARKRTTQGHAPLEQMVDTRVENPADTLARHETEPRLYAEVSRLPAKYRDPVVLHYLQGQTQDEVARQLGWPVGTVSGRLARARTLLRKRLTARGVTVLAGLFVASVSEGSSLGAVAASLVTSTSQAALRFAATKTASAVVSPHAAALAEGVLKTMFVNKLKMVVMLLLAVGLLGAGAAWQVGVIAADDHPSAQAAEEKPAPRATPRRRLMKVPSPIDGIIAVIGREIRKGENVPANQITTVRTSEGEKKYGRLHEGDRIEEGDVLARLDDRLAQNALAVQTAKVDAAQADYDSAIKTKYEAQARLDRAEGRLGKANGKVSADDYGAAVLTRDRYKYEEDSKKAGLKVAKLDLERAKISLEKHMIRSPVRGIITAIYKERGEAVQRLEPVFQIEILPQR